MGRPTVPNTPFGRCPNNQIPRFRRILTLALSQQPSSIITALQNPVPQMACCPPHPNFCDELPGGREWVQKRIEQKGTSILSIRGMPWPRGSDPPPQRMSYPPVRSCRNKFSSYTYKASCTLALMWCQGPQWRPNAQSGSLEASWGPRARVGQGFPCEWAP